MRNQLHGIHRVCLATLLSACTTNSTLPGGDTQPDTGTDSAVPDGADDASGPDPNHDVAPDDVEHETNSPVEICDNWRDDDGDRDADCDDEDCESAANCRQPAGEICDNELDDDGDGFIDCDDCDCSHSLSCSGFGCDGRAVCDPDCVDGRFCVGGGCVVVCPTPEDYVPAANWAYVADVYLPASDDPAPCCLDYSGDGEIDNGLPRLLEVLGVPRELHMQVLAAALGTWIVEYRGEDLTAWKAQPWLSFWPATNDLDGDGAPDQDRETQRAGAGVFRVLGEYYSSWGAPVQFNSSYYDEGLLLSDPVVSEFSLSFDQLLPGVGRVVVRIDSAWFEATLDDTLPTRTVDESVAGVEVGGLKVGGLVSIGSLLDGIDRRARSCTCADGIDGSNAVVVHGEHLDMGQYVASCPGGPYDVSMCSEDDVFCSETLNRLCAALGTSFLGPLADIDTDNSGVPDAVAFGLRLTLVPATLADPWFTSAP